jgi:DNA polymerase-3 subunit delta'
MHPAAANAFLKTLEEPPADTLIVLTAPGPALLPETIVSRCMPLRFAPLAPATVRAILERELSGEELEFAVRHAQGRLRPELRRDARRLRALRDAVLGTLDELDRLDYGGIAEQAGAWTGGEDWAFVLECMETWYHDLALLAAGADEGRLINGDRRDALWRWCARLSPERATAGLRQVLASRDAMLLNVNKGLALESLCLALRALTHAQGEKPPWTAA